MKILFIAMGWTVVLSVWLYIDVGHPLENIVEQLRIMNDNLEKLRKEK